MVLGVMRVHNTCVDPNKLSIRGSAHGKAFTEWMFTLVPPFTGPVVGFKANPCPSEDKITIQPSPTTLSYMPLLKDIDKFPLLSTSTEQVNSEEERNEASNRLFPPILQDGE
jgi:hypothetical protein